MTNKGKRYPENEEPKQHVERRTKLDEHEEQKFVDDVPLEDLKIEAEDEKDKSKSKNDSQSERKFRQKKNSDKDNERP